MLDPLVLEVLDYLPDEVPADRLPDCLTAHLKGRTGLSPESSLDLL